jgi:CheY-like chemotaxis protein
MKQTHSRRILIVDDNEDAAVSLAALLRALGHETHTALDGETALASVDSLRPDIVLLDIGLPDLDGYEVAQRLREGGAREIRLIALTGYGQEEDLRRAKEAGFDQHLLKPVNLETLKNLLEAS